MGSQNSCQKCNFEDVQCFIQNKNGYLLNTLPSHSQDLLIEGTLSASDEERTMNQLLKVNTNVKIILYGENSNDDSVYRKYKQMNDLGFYNILIYSGGIFEWMLLQDIYGADDFPTTKNDLDILKFKPKSAFHLKFLENQ